MSRLCILLNRYPCSKHRGMLLIGSKKRPSTLGIEESRFSRIG